MTTFTERLWEASKSSRSLVCVGLDPDPALMAIPDVTEFNRAIIDATHDLVCAYKPNLAFYEALGRPGLDALVDTVAHIRSAAPGAIVIGDAKRGDIGSSNAMYARALFETWDFDAATINGYTGGEAMEPFLNYEGRGAFILCRSSNPGARELQDRVVAQNGTSMALYELLASRALTWNTKGNLGLVAGSTYPEDIGKVRSRCPGMPILVPGVGSQAGDLEMSVRLGLDSTPFNLIISSSRSITYASKDPRSFADAARAAAVRLRDNINLILDREGRTWSES